MMAAATERADAELVAAELAELAPCSGQQALAEARLLAMLPVAEAARVLRDEILASLAGDGEGRRWGRYLALEEALIRLRGGEPRHRWQARPSLWHELAVGEEPEPLRHIRRRFSLSLVDLP